ncbi:hypothetical protein GOV13_03640 [Candidatus Pacearchaeota archaeon]|nr:hypothetical protein [Candidatus Pacearchaeota archaeon]
MTKIINKISNEIVERLRDDKNLLSLTLVGSSSNYPKKLNEFNDIDFVFIYNNLKRADIKRLKYIQKSLEEKYSSNKIGITHTFKIGPIKIISKKPKTIMLHFLVYSKNNYLKYESNLTRFSFQHHSPLCGKHLNKINSLKKVNFQDLFNDIDGIPAMKEWIVKKKGTYIEPIGRDVKFTDFELKDKQYLEVIFYCVLNLTMNMERAKRGYFKFNKNTLNQFESDFPLELNDFPSEIFLLKDKLRKGHNFSLKELDNIKDKSLKFISQCELIIKENYLYD